MTGTISYDFSGTTAVVTGSTKGIGRGIARAFAEAGANVVVNSRTPREVSETASALDSGTQGEVVGIAADMANLNSIEELIAQANHEFGQIDVLVNNAAVWPKEESMLTASIEDWEFMMGVNVRAPFYASQLAARQMVENGEPGTIINVSSHTGDRRSGDTGLYGTSKSALNGVTWRLAMDFAEHGIRVNGVSTCRTDTYQFRKGVREAAGRGSDADIDDLLAQRAEQIPLGRLGDVSDIAAAVLFLASDGATYITGDVLRVSGGDNLR
ncbi:SDR family NAD(P)-dependent oxidoreductase [Haloferax gibbonsii]|uniref:3-oxoacyl-ACP reductase n=1 Tax=Haloferax gibbonsii TaxID=35746 RepID=A0A0K1IZG2_HALGI|nr:glucose 1-dehydrogenase [Haloferax gibbonsii]AKU09829.1 3-oxoacyl-ACP reductase [Haloferax gibbonsii]